MLATQSRVPVVVGRDRVAAARLALREFRVNALVLDDGFQQRTRFPGAFRIVTVNSMDPFGNGSLLPAGPMREPLAALGEADAIIPTRGPLTGEARRLIGAWEPARRVSACAWELSGLRGLAGRPSRPPGWLRGRRVLAAAAIADPDGFAGLLQRAIGPVPVERFELPDHHAWGPVERARAMTYARNTGCEAVVITGKDAVKWPVGGSGSLPVLVARAGLRFPDGGRQLAEWLRAYLGEFPPS